jgi:hypothetical protein
MALIAFRGDAEAKNKVVRLVKPTNTDGIQPRIVVNNKTLRFEDWDPATIAAAIENSEFPELEGLTAAVDGGNVDVSGEVDQDFVLSFLQTPTATVENVAGANPRNTVVSILFNGAVGGTYTLTIDGETTAAIAFGDITDARAKITALAGVGAGDFELIESAGNYRLTLKGVFAGAPVVVSVNGGGLTNVVGSLVRSQTSQAVRERYDVWGLSFLNGSQSSNVTIDGNTARIFSDDTLAQVRAKLQALTTGGRLLNVYGGRLSAAGGANFWVLEFAGYSTAVRPTVSVSGLIGLGAAAVLTLLYDATAGISLDFVGAGERRNELYIFDFSETAAGAKMQVEIDGKTIEIAETATGAGIATALNTASEYGEFTYLNPLISGHGQPARMHMLYWVRNDLYDNANIPDAYLKKAGGLGTLKTLAHGGSATAPAVLALYRTPSTITGGTFTLTFAEGTTGAIAWNANAAAVQSAVASVVVGATCSTGDGSAANPWILNIPISSTNPNQIPTAAASFTGQGTASTTVVVQGYGGASGSAIVTVSTRAVSGTYSLRYGYEGPVAFGPGISGAAFKTLLQQFPSLAAGGDTLVEYDATAGTYEIQFQGNLANKTVGVFAVDEDANTLATAADDTGAIVLQRATGPTCYAEPSNWTLGRLPEDGDDIVIDSTAGGISHGLAQFLTVATVNTTTNRLKVAGGFLDWLPNQRIRFYVAIGASLPAPLSIGVDYFVSSPDWTNGTFAVSATSNGPAVDLTTTGTGTFAAGVRVRGLTISASMSDAIGLEENNANGFREHRNRYLRLGVSENVEVGEGIGGGSGLIRLDVGISGPVVRIVATGSSSESGFPAFNLLANSDALRFGMTEGSAGIAAGDDEAATVGDIGIHGGECILGTVDVVRDVLQNAGTLAARKLSIGGVFKAQG